MNKKMNYLAIVPVYGTCIIYFWLFIKAIRQEVNKRKLFAYLFSSAIIGFLSILFTIIFLNFLNSLFGIAAFIEKYGLVVSFVAGGYLMNLFTFILLHKKWIDLFL